MNCARHPKEETSLTCGRCGTPVCSRCTVHADVGIRCPGCSATKKVGARRRIPIGSAIGILTTVLILGTWGYWLFGIVPLPFGSSGNDNQDPADEGPPPFYGVVTVGQMIDPWEQDDAEKPPTAGRRFVALELTAENPQDKIEPIVWSETGLKLTDAENFAYAPTSPLTEPRLRYLTLEPGEKTSSWVVFEVDERNAVKSLTYWATDIALP